jgi:hypothetical protein
VIWQGDANRIALECCRCRDAAIRRERHWEQLRVRTIAQWFDGDWVSNLARGTERATRY